MQKVKRGYLNNYEYTKIQNITEQDTPHTVFIQAGNCRTAYSTTCIHDSGNNGLLQSSGDVINMTITDKAKIYSKYFITDTRQDGKSFVKIKDSYADTQTEDSRRLQESVRTAHGDRFPNDWVYGTYADLLQNLTEYELDTIDDLDEVRSEIVDSYVDIYTYNLTKWLNEDINNVYYLTQALEESDLKDGFQLLAYAQYLAIDEVMNEVYDLLSKCTHESINKPTGKCNDCSEKIE